VRGVVTAVAAVYILLAAATLWSRSEARERAAPRYFSAEEIARGRRFSAQRRLLFWSSEAAQLWLLAWLAFSGTGLRLRERCVGVAGGRWWAAALLVGAAIFAAQAALAFPWSLYGGLYHLRAWGLTQRSFLSWLGDYLKALGVGAGVGAVLLLGFYGALRFAPRTWWLLATAGSAVLAVFFAYLAPVLIAPLFNTFTPLAATRHAPLLPQVQALARAAGLQVRDVLVMDASRQGSHTNAYFTGFGATRRIVLYDTLLESHGDRETLSILGHELGHWRHDHIVKGIALGTLGAGVGFLALAGILSWAAATSRVGWTRPADPASLPLVLLLSALGGLLSMPVGNAVSRSFEREADRDSLELYGHPEVFIEAEKRLARDNIANVVPADLNVILFATHPPTLERIAAAEAFAARGPASP
jgi:STE24 endopeptidase